MKNAHRAVIILFLAAMLIIFFCLLIMGMDISASLFLEVIGFLAFAAGICAAAYAVNKLIAYVKPRITAGKRPETKE